ncbi:MAG: chromosome partitioning protein [Legionellales bacterium]|nr:MAG: chromosome partitioning protein [Legionellales bacterium]
MTHIIAFANQKGGVGKTTSCVNVAAGLALLRHKVLLVDLDPQGNASVGSGVAECTISSNEVLLEEVSVAAAICSDLVVGYDVLPATGDLTAAEVLLLQRDNYQQALKNALAEVTSKYDFILIDCPPALNSLTLNALVAATAVIIPMQCEYFALEGLSALLDTIEQVQQSVNSDLVIAGLIRTMYDPRNKLATDVGAQLTEHFGKLVYKTIIPRNVRLAEAPSHGLPALLYDKSAKGSKAYMALSKEISNRFKTSGK